MTWPIFQSLSSKNEFSSVRYQRFPVSRWTYITKFIMLFCFLLPADLIIDRCQKRKSNPLRRSSQMDKVSPRANKDDQMCVREQCFRVSSVRYSRGPRFRPRLCSICTPDWVFQSSDHKCVSGRMQTTHTALFYASLKNALK